MVVSRSMWPELLADAVHEQLDPPASRADVDVEVLLVDEELTDVAEDSPARPLVKIPRAGVLEPHVTAGAAHRVRGGSLFHDSQLAAAPVFDSSAWVVAATVAGGAASVGTKAAR